jgi:hypothetical protein
MRINLLAFDGFNKGVGSSPNLGKKGLDARFYRFPQPVKKASYFLHIEITCKDGTLEQRQAL